MKPIYKKYISRVSLSWGGCLVLFLAIQILILGPQGRKRAELERQLTAKRQTYEAAMTGAREESRAKWQEQIKELENKLHGFAIGAEESANLTFDISQLAKDKHAHSFSIKGKDGGFESQTPFSDSIGENRLNVDFAAGFREFATLLNALERNRPVVFVDKFKLERSKKGEPGHPVNMELSVFVLKEPGSEPAELM
jgi:hypothetical protein